MPIAISANAAKPIKPLVDANSSTIIGALRISQTANVVQAEKTKPPKAKQNMPMMLDLCLVSLFDIFESCISIPSSHSLDYRKDKRFDSTTLRGFGRVKFYPNQTWILKLQIVG
jgi:hypothetical protein